MRLGRWLDHGAARRRRKPRPRRSTAGSPSPPPRCWSAVDRSPDSAAAPRHGVPSRDGSV